MVCLSDRMKKKVEMIYLIDRINENDGMLERQNEKKKSVNVYFSEKVHENYVVE